MSSQALLTDRWRPWHFAAAGLMALAGVAATFDAWSDILRIAWMDEESSHIFIVPVVAAWLIWVRRARLRHVRPAFTMLGPIMVAVGWACSYYGFHRLGPERIAELAWPLRSLFWPMWRALDLAGFGHAGQVLWHGGAVLVVLGCILSVLGRNVIFRFFPAVALLIFVIPVPGSLRLAVALPLQDWTARISESTLALAGMDVQRSGNMLTVNGQPVTIAEACNGIRMVFALILVVYAFAFGMPLRNRVRVLLLMASPIAAIACNVPRIWANAIIYGYFDQDKGRLFHDYSGWLMLPIAFLLLYGLIRLMRWMMIPVERYTLASQTA
jgi:exosortase